MKDSDWEILYELYKNPNMTTIVNRTPKGLEFTSEGKFLGEQAKVYLDFMNRTKAKLEEMKSCPDSVITIGSSYTYSKYILSDLLIEYKTKHPNIEISIVNEQSNILFRKMLEGSIDVGFIRGDYEGAVNKLLLGKNQAYLVTKEPVDIEELPKLQGIGYKTNDRTKEILDNWWKNRFGTEAPANMIVGYIDVAWQLIHKGLGYTICFLPDNFENEYDLCLTPLENKDGTGVYRNTWFVYSKNKRISNSLEEFIQYIEKEYQSGNLT